MKFHPNDSDIIYVSTMDIGYGKGGGEIWRSTDGGNTFQEVTPTMNSADSADIFFIGVSPAAPDFLFTRYNVIGPTKKNVVRKSPDKGTTWKNPVNVNYKSGYRTFGTSHYYGQITVSPKDTQIIYFPHTRMYSSKDGGKTINQHYGYYDEDNTHVDTRDLAILEGSDPQKQGEQDILIQTNDGGISKTYKGTKNEVADSNYWKNLNGKGLYITQFYGLGQSEKDANVIYGGTLDNGMYSKTQFKDSFCYNDIGDGGDVVVDAQDPQKAYTTSNSKELYHKVYTSGCNWNSMGLSDPINYWHRPRDIHNATNTLYMGKKDIWKMTNSPYNGSAQFKKITLKPSFKNNIGNLDIIEVAPSDTNVIYAVEGDDAAGHGSQYRIFKSTNHGQDWTDISDSLNLAYGTITDLEVDPRYPFRFVISVGGFADKPDSNRVLVRKDGTYIDISDGLPNVPALDLSLSAGRNIYLGTDVGVYYKISYDKNEEWKCYNKGLPVCIVNEVDVNTCAGKLRVSTFGRGIWQADLARDDYLKTHLVEEYWTVKKNITWNDKRVMDRHIQIAKGDTLTVKDTVFMPNEGRIKVMEGATLIVDGGVIANRCGRMWKGIFVWGDSEKSQLVDDNYDLYDGQSPYHGKVVLKNGAEIANARIGISTSKLKDDGSTDWAHTGGGIIQAKNSTFKNNFRAIEFMEFHNPPVYGSNNSVINQEPGNQSFFRNCDFLITDDPGLPLEADTTQAYHDKSMVSLWSVNGIQFKGCKFINKIPNQYPNAEKGSLVKGNGIYAAKASFKVDAENGPCDKGPNKPSVFKGLSRGVISSGYGGIERVKIKDSRFINNERGIVLKGGNNALIFRDTFLITNGMGNQGVEPMKPIALFSLWHKGYRISKCGFYDSSVSYEGYGIVSRQYLRTSTNGGLIEKNYLEGHGYGIQTEGNNSELIIQCNKLNGDYTPLGGDLALNPDYDPNMDNTPYFGICSTGFNTDPYNEYLDPDANHIITGPKSACNICPPNYNNPSAFYPVSSQNPNPPDTSNIISDGQLKLCQSNSIVSCEDNSDLCYDNPDVTDPPQNGLVLGYNEDINELSYTLNGAAVAFTDTIAGNSVDPARKVTLLNDFTPYLSDTILQLTIIEATNIPEDTVEEILIENSSLSYEVLNTLNDRDPPFAQSTIDTIIAYQEDLSPRSKLVNEINALQAKKQSLLNEGAMYYNRKRFADTLPDSLSEESANYYDSTIQFLLLDSSFRTRSMLINSLVNKGYLAKADTLLNKLPAEDPEYDDFISFIEVKKSLQQDGRNVLQLTSSEQHTLANISQKEHKTAFHARSMLAFSTDSNWIYFPKEFDWEEQQQKRSIISEQPFISDKKEEASYFKLFPNPSDGKVTVKYDLKDNLARNFRFKVLNVQGKTLSIHELKTKMGSFILDESNLNQGTYFVTLIRGEEIINSQKFVMTE